MSRARSDSTCDLPPGIIVRKRTSADYYYYQTTSIGQKRREYSLGKDRVEAIARWRELAAEMPPEKRKIGLRPWVAGEMFKACKSNAKRRGIAFDLTVEDIGSLITKSNGKCSISGIQFDLFKDHAHRVRHWSPSIDRIDCAKGYELGNVRLVASAVNIALSDFGEDVLVRIAKGIVKTKYRKIV